MIGYNPVTNTYRCRASLDSWYDKLYNQFIPTSSYICTYEDFPWDYFRFADPIDDVRIREQFDVYEVTDDENVRRQ